MLLATVLGSGMAMLDGTVVNIALPRIGKDLGAGLSGLQWTINAYTLTLAGFLLLGGSLGDRFGRRRMFVTGVVWFAAASVLCAMAPTSEALIAARALQGLGGALLTPGSLAIIEASFRLEDRGAAIGAWSGLGGVAVAVGPFLGGWLVEAVSWRLIFVINIPLAVVVVLVALRHVPESRDPGMAPGLDLPGAVLAALGLGGVIYALIESGDRGWTSPAVVVTGIGGLVALAVFVAVEARSPHPMLPLAIFRSRQFTAANLVTFAVYAALSGSLFLLPIELQEVVGFSPLKAGTALVPLTVVMLLLSARAGRLAQRIGPRLPMTIGPIVAGCGLALLTRVGAGSSYVGAVFPAVTVFALGLALTVAPLTTTVLAAASEACGSGLGGEQRRRPGGRPPRRRRTADRRGHHGLGVPEPQRALERLPFGHVGHGGHVRGRRAAGVGHHPEPGAGGGRGGGTGGPVASLCPRRRAPGRMTHRRV